MESFRAVVSRIVCLSALACLFGFTPMASIHAQIIEDPSVLSGSWYDPARNGEGFHIEILPDGQALAIWFTYPGDTDNNETRQAWILGIGTWRSRCESWWWNFHWSNSLVESSRYLCTAFWWKWKSFGHVARKPS